MMPEAPEEKPVRAGRFLVDRLVDVGLDRAEADRAASLVLAAIAAELRVGHYVEMPGIGRLYPKLRAPKWVPGKVGREARQDRVVALKNNAILVRGDPYATIGTSGDASMQKEGR